MKTRRADEHLQSLEREVNKWGLNPYTIFEETNFEGATHTFKIEIAHTPEIIPMLFGDFVCCLRAALDQLAWKLAHLDKTRVFSRTEQRRIQFPIFEDDNSTYRDRLSLFPATVTDIIDRFQPYHRGTAFRDDPLWQLNELWNLDKHRTVPALPYGVEYGFGFPNWQRFAATRFNLLTYHYEVKFPLPFVWNCKVQLKPEVSVEILFGEANNFEVSLKRVREINDFVREEVIPAFMGFFP